MSKHVMKDNRSNNVNWVNTFRKISFNSVHSIEDNETLEIYDADSNALKTIPVGRTLAEAKQLGRVVTPKQYRCTFCVTGICGVVIDTIQCFCGAIQCPPVTTTPGRERLHYLLIIANISF